MWIFVSYLANNNLQSAIAAASLLPPKSLATSVLSIRTHADPEHTEKRILGNSFQYNQIACGIIQHRYHSLAPECGFVPQVAARGEG